MHELDIVRGSVEAWRRTRHPRFAAIAQWATVRALAAAPRPALATGTKRAEVEAWQRAFEERDELDLPRLLAAVGTGRSPLSTERVVLLSTLDDPRVVSGLLGLLEAPPFRAGTAQPFFRACATALAASGDPRVRPALVDLAARYKGIIETSVGDVVAALLARTAAQLDQVKPGPLPEALERQAAAWETRFDAERAAGQRETARGRSARVNDDELLAAVFAAPDDDVPRLVYADALSERGDARGEFIALQLARARGEATPAQRARERELSADAKRLSAWALPLSSAGEVGFGRGFPEFLALNAKTAKKAVGLAALRTLRRVVGLEACPVKTAVELLASPLLRGATHVERLSEKVLAGLAGLEGPLPWSSVALVDAPGPRGLLRFPHLRALELCTAPTGPFEGARALDSLVVRVGRGLDAGLFASVPGLRSLAFTAWQDPWSSVGPFAQLAALERLTVENAPPPAQLEGCGVTHLTLKWTHDLRLEGVLAALGQLRALTFSGSVVPADVQAVALAAARARHFEGLGLGLLALERPFTDAGVAWLQLSTVHFDASLEVLASLPADAANRVVVHPLPLGPAARLPPPPTEAQLERVKHATPLPLEVAWY